MSWITGQPSLFPWVSINHQWYINYQLYTLAGSTLHLKACKIRKNAAIFQMLAGFSSRLVIFIHVVFFCSLCSITKNYYCSHRLPTVDRCLLRLVHVDLLPLLLCVSLSPLQICGEPLFAVIHHHPKCAPIYHHQYCACIYYHTFCAVIHCCPLDICRCPLECLSFCRPGVGCASEWRRPV